MPQEMRYPENRTKECIPEVEKLMALHAYLSSPSVIDKGSVFQHIVVESIWPDMNIIDAGLVRDGLLYLDTLVEVKQEDKPN